MKLSRGNRSRALVAGVQGGIRGLLARLMLGGLLAACGGVARPSAVPASQETLIVFTAASLTEAFQEIGVAVEAANPGTQIAFNFAGSPALRTQLREGARADLFAAADEPTMQGARQDGTIAGEPRIFVQNRLIIIAPVASRVAVARPQDLATPGLKLVLAQKEVPAGSYARQVLAKMSADPAFGADFSTRVLANLVSEEANVRQVVAKVQLGEADAGIVYSSDVTPAVRGALKSIDLPAAFNVTARYPIALVKGAANQAAARAFIEYLLSPAGQATLAKHGFIPVDPVVTTSAGSGRGSADDLAAVGPALGRRGV